MVVAALSRANDRPDYLRPGDDRLDHGRVIAPDRADAPRVDDTRSPGSPSGPLRDRRRPGNDAAPD